ncbi:hypothetical protein [Nocardia sp. AG03]|uniref:hypothetical protein n=1 Tax=Nocardia sp. AG03 TaxID=3025312 RepID=UPI0024184D53|nr:hypothetical protein [Nocardia sp. AG03]
MGEGRFVLYGDDDSGEVRWHETAIDMLAGAPVWLPYDKLNERIDGNEVGCVYWYEEGAWARAPYPEDLHDDGLSTGMEHLVDRDMLLRNNLYPLLVDEARGEIAAQLLDDAEAGRLEPRRLLERLRRDDDRRGSRDLAAITRALVGGGIAV